MDYNDEKMIDLPYPGGIAPGVFLVDFGISIPLNRHLILFAMVTIMCFRCHLNVFMTLMK